MRSLTTRIAFTICLLAPTLAIADSPGPYLNTYRAYPPSCLSYPLPTPSGPGTSTQVALPLSDGTGSETVTFAVWRTSCSDGKSALLGAFGRTTQNANAVPAPLFPSISISQGSSSIIAGRVALEPNTVISDIPGGVPFFGTFYSFVFENWPFADQPQFNFSETLTLSFDQASGYPPVVINVPAYDSSQYADASQPMQISGYMTGAWYDPLHSGEGIQVEVGELGPPGTAYNRYIGIAWYTYDATGAPYWLYGEGIFTAGDRSATVSMVYSTGGGFAGNFGGVANTPTWGTINVQFFNCTVMQFSYQSNAGLPSGVPTGTGTKTWTRISSMNGLSCD